MKKEIKEDKIKVVGKILKLGDIQNLSVKEWPLITIDHINKGGHYVFFDSGFIDSSFLTTLNFQTQFGREVVCEIEKKSNKKFLNMVKKIEKESPQKEIWRWQNFLFEDKIIKTINDSKKQFTNYQKIFKDDYLNFKFEII